MANMIPVPSRGHEDEDYECFARFRGVIVCSANGVRTYSYSCRQIHQEQRHRVLFLPGAGSGAQAPEQRSMRFLSVRCAETWELGCLLEQATRLLNQLNASNQMRSGGTGDLQGSCVLLAPSAGKTCL